jgi:flagellar basal body P-ring formation protein FlgA
MRTPQFNRLLVSFALCLLICVVVQASTNRAIVVVQPETIAKQDKLTLGDIADIRAPDEDTFFLLRGINLGYSPEVGMVRQISREKISVALAAAGFSADSVELKSQSLVSVRRESQLVDLKLLRTEAEKAALLALQARGANAQLVKLELPKKVEVRTGTLELRASTLHVRNTFAPFSIAVEILVDGKVARRLQVPAQVEATAKVVVAATDLAEKTRVRTENYRLEIVRLDRDINSYIFDPEQLRGVTLNRAIASGQPITTGSFVPDIVVKRGDVVRIVGDSGRLKISLTGEARASGHVGDRIQVKNLQSGTLLQAIVVDEGIVTVRF